MIDNVLKELVSKLSFIAPVRTYDTTRTKQSEFAAKPEKMFWVTLGPKGEEATSKWHWPSPLFPVWHHPTDPDFCILPKKSYKESNDP